MVGPKIILLFLTCWLLSDLQPTESLLLPPRRWPVAPPTSFRRRLLCRQSSDNNNDATTPSSSTSSSSWLSLPEAIESRNACKAYQRYDGKTPETDDDDEAALEASPPDPWILQQAAACLDLARLSPSSFNTQPYKVVLVHSVAQKMALAKTGCLGPNARRVLDADCTAVFLADKQVLRDILPQRRRRRQKQKQQDTSSRTGPPTANTPLLYITLFSSGYPLPRWLSATVSFLVRTAMSWLDLVTRKLFRYPLPTLSNAETWATKQTSLVAMTYMLACAAKGIATTPMEGVNAAGIRRVVGARGARYSVPLIVATGRTAVTTSNKNKTDRKVQTRRYPTQQVLFGDSLGKPLLLSGDATNDKDGGGGGLWDAVANKGGNEEDMNGDDDAGAANEGKQISTT